MQGQAPGKYFWAARRPDERQHAVMDIMWPGVFLDVALAVGMRELEMAVLARLVEVKDASIKAIEVIVDACLGHRQGLLHVVEVRRIASCVVVVDVERVIPPRS